MANRMMALDRTVWLRSESFRNSARHHYDRWTYRIAAVHRGLLLTTDGVQWHPFSTSELCSANDTATMDSIYCALSSFLRSKSLSFRVVSVPGSSSTFDISSLITRTRCGRVTSQRHKHCNQHRRRPAGAADAGRLISYRH